MVFVYVYIQPLIIELLLFQDAVNLFKEMDAETILSFKGRQEESEGKRHILIFYCEFSSERGPKMYVSHCSQ